MLTTSLPLGHSNPGRFPLTMANYSEQRKRWMEHKIFGFWTDLTAKFGPKQKEVHFC